MADSVPDSQKELEQASSSMISDLVAEGMEIMNDSANEQNQSIDEPEPLLSASIPKAIKATIVQYLEKKAFWEQELRDSEAFAQADYASIVYPDGRRDFEMVENVENEEKQEQEKPQESKDAPTKKSKDLPIDDVAEEVVSQYGSEVLFFLKMLDGVDRTLDRFKVITNEAKKSITLDRILADMDEGKYE